ncbi:MAG: transglycosylase SLT domain-containing protein [Bryobacteraceae bacterium]
MKIRRCWEESIQVRWLSVAAMLCAMPAAMPAQDLARAVEAYKAKPAAATRAAVIKAANPRALGRLAVAYADLEGRRMPEALEGFLQVRRELPHLSDHADYGAAQALMSLGRKSEALPYLLSIAKAERPVSPHRAAGVFAASDILVEANEPAQAVSLLAANIPVVPEAKGRYLFAGALEAAGNAKAAAIEYQRVFFSQARHPEAAKAAEAMTRLRTALGADYPPEMPGSWLERAGILMESGRGKEAAAELTALLPSLTSGDRERAQVRIGAARYRARDYAGALTFLSGLTIKTPVLDAERLHYIAEAARRLDRTAERSAALRDLAARHPVSQWRLDALLGGVNGYLIANQPEQYEPIYQACYTTFARDERAGDCHWKYTWSRYLRRAADAGTLLREQVTQFPDSSDAPAAMYFLGRQHEQRRELGHARAYYEAASSRFPNYYYGVISRERLASPTLARVKPDATLSAELAALGLPESGTGSDFEMDEATRLRIRRGTQLAQASIADWAELELRFGAGADAKRNLIGLELAQMAIAQGKNAQGLRYVKAYSGPYLKWHIEDAPLKFWKLAFPLYFRDDLERESKANSLDPYIVAGLIRQESEFDPGAVSRARAIGLTQIMPATGRELSQRLKLRRFTTAMLKEPEVNLKLGTYYLKRILDSQQGFWVSTLAGYNAGPTRAKRWMTWANYREPSEFIETIPFEETRNYVQSVLRNADVYRRLYGAASARVRSTVGANNASPSQRSGRAAGRP